MTTNYADISNVIYNAMAETGIKENEIYNVYIISDDNNLLEFELETEWSLVTCYADLESAGILGIMSEPKTIEKLLEDTVMVSGRAKSLRKAA